STGSPIGSSVERPAHMRPVSATKPAVPARVLVIDDHPLFLEGIGMLVDRLDGVELIGRCDSGAAGIRALEDDPPDLVVLDFQLGDMTGLDVLQRISEKRLPTRVPFVSGRLQGEDAYRVGRRFSVIRCQTPSPVDPK